MAVSRRSVAVILVFVIVTSAGIVSGGPTSQPQQPTPVSSERPATPHHSNNSTATDYPPGAAPEGITNASRLISAHKAILQNSSYQVNSRWEAIGRSSSNPPGNESQYEADVFTVDVERDQNTTNASFTGDNDTSTYWITPNGTMINSSTTDYGYLETIYTYEPEGGYYQDITAFLEVFPSAGVESYLHALDYRLVNATTQNNRTFYTYASTGINDSVEPNVGATPVTTTTERINATVVVSDHGAVHSFTATETHTISNETVQLNQSYSLEGLGETNASAPPWASEKIAAVNPSITGNGSVIALHHLGGATLTNTTILFYTSSSRIDRTINRTVEPGGTLYLYLTGEQANRTLQASVSEPPAVNDSFVDFSTSNVSLMVSRHVMGSYDSGIQIEVFALENSSLPTVRHPIPKQYQSKRVLGNSRALETKR